MSLHGALGILFALAFCTLACAVGTASENDDRAKEFLAKFDKEIRPLSVEVSRRWWDANLSGKDEDYQKKQEAETTLDLRLSDPATFADLKAIHSGKLSDPLVARQIRVLYLQYLAKQVDPELLKKITAKSNAVEQSFNLFRPTVDGKELTDNDVRDVLRKSKDSARRRAVWEASKEVGRKVEKDLKDLIRLRNEVAKKLGFADYHVMQLALNEQDQKEILKLFDELDTLTREPFRAAKKKIDAALAARYGVTVSQLRPWHYQDPFFQEAPEITAVDLESVYRTVDIVKVCREFYAGIGLPVDDVLARSDLYEKKGKNPHAFCTDIDREGDVRILCNIVPSRQWLSTSAHELGHAVYSKFVPRSVPWVLRSEAHTLTTEGIAMMFEHFPDNAAWLEAMGVKVPDPQQFNATTAELRRNQLLVFSRWAQVMFRFEKELYANPDADMNRVWWDLVEKYQEVKRPEGRNAPDYAAKIHICVAPAYYHNYQMGQMFASQVHHALVREVLGSKDPATAIYVGNRAAGKYLQDRVFAPGATLPWNELTRHATGAPLNAKAFAEDLGK
jgi:peptidyl-dipeptidase A